MAHGGRRRPRLRAAAGASHPGRAARDAERAVLGAVRYQSNRAVLHTDASFLPRARVALSARNRAALAAIAAKFDAAQSRVLPLDSTQPAAAAPVLDAVVAEWGGVDLVLFFAGTHKSVRAWELEAKTAREIISGLERGRFEIHFPRRFTLWLKLLRILPYWLYFRLVHRMTGL